MRKIIFTANAWEDYIYWQTEDKKTLKRINALLKDIDRGGNEGIGKPEALKNCEGCWSRRIDDANRLVYRLTDEIMEILQCRGHYDD
ncbi:MAG: Txe/YoeB family addiction module toxin [Synergistaceae bacterium]|nr:Txe/YoeB family addiction module toxin [Synergistaceae bacterium]